MIEIFADSTAPNHGALTTEGMLLVVGAIGTMLTGILAAWFSGSTKTNTLKHQQRMEQIALETGANIKKSRDERERQLIGIARKIDVNSEVNEAAIKRSDAAIEATNKTNQKILDVNVRMDDANTRMDKAENQSDTPLDVNIVNLPSKQ